VSKLGAIALVVLAFAGVALTTAEDSGGDGLSYRLVFDNAFGLSEGGDLRIAGVRAGVIERLELSRGYPTKAVAVVEITEPGLSELREDARCEVRPQSLIGEYFVNCQPGDSGERLPDGGEVPVGQTESTIPFDLVANIQRLPVRERLRLILVELGAGLAGRPEDLAKVLRRAHPGLRETTEALRVLGRQTDTIERTITDADRVLVALANRRRDVTSFVREAGDTAAITASRREELATTFRVLPEFLAALRPNMARLGELSENQIPLLRDLQLAAADLDTFLTRLRPFSRNARPAVRALGRASGTGLNSLHATDEEVEVLRQAAGDAPAVAKPLRQLLQTLDDRRRAVENDARAKATDPPAPDKTHVPASRQAGFTGMEAFWNYYYWQALATNAVDPIGHVLRISATLDLAACSNYQKTITAETKKCNRWLGPYQPGVNAPDPTEIRGEEGERSSPRSSGRPANSAAQPGYHAPVAGRETHAVLDYLMMP
jgi:ABC-type transporter Mla subunit MlaD